MYARIAYRFLEGALMLGGILTVASAQAIQKVNLGQKIQSQPALFQPVKVTLGMPLSGQAEPPAKMSVSLGSNISSPLRPKKIDVFLGQDLEIPSLSPLVSIDINADPVRITARSTITNEPCPRLAHGGLKRHGEDGCDIMAVPPDPLILNPRSPNRAAIKISHSF